MARLTPLEPLILTDSAGDQLILQFWPGKAGQAIGAPVTAVVKPNLPVNVSGSHPATLITNDNLREIIRWAADALGETPQLAAQPNTFNFRVPDGEDVIIANHDLGNCYFCKQPIAIGALVECIRDENIEHWAHDLCRPKNAAITVTEVEG